MTHLAEDDYQIFAIADKNKNKNYDIRNEKIGFISSKINPSRDTNKVNFVLFQQRDTVFRITSFKLNSDKTQLKFSNGLKQVSIISETIVSHQLLNNSKTLAIFPHSSDIKESMLHIIAKDSNNNVIDTNIALKFTLDKTLFNSKKGIIKSIETSDNQYFKDSLSFIISVNEPLQELLFSNIFIISELDTSMIKNRGTIIHQINENFTKINFKVKANLSDTVKILIKPGFIKGVQGNLNKEKEMTFLPYDKKEYSALKGTITTKETNYIFLLYKDKKVIDKRYNNKEFDYPIMKPGEYSIEIQLDKNKNSKLDNGSFYKKIQPEKVYRYPNKVKLKANWEINNLKVEF